MATKEEIRLIVQTEIRDAIRDMQRLGDTSEEAGEHVARGAEKGAGAMTDFKSALDMAKDVAKEFMGYAKQAFELAKLGAEAERAETAFRNLSGGEEMATRNLEAMLSATDNTISEMDAMSAAAKLMSMGLASTTGDLEEVTNMAVTLGRAFGRDATQSIDEFSLMLANESKMRLDTFGISSGNVRKRMEELGETFKEATFAEGIAAMERLGDTGEDTASQFEQLDAAIMDTKVALAKELTPALANFASNVTSWLDFHAVKDEFWGLVEQVEQYDKVVANGARKRIDALAYEHGSWVDITEMQTEIKAMTEEMDLLTAATKHYEAEMGAARITGLQAATAQREQAEAARVLASATEEAELSMSNMEIQQIRRRRAAEQAAEADKLAAEDAETLAKAEEAAARAADIAAQAYYKRTEAVRQAKEAQGDLFTQMLESEPTEETLAARLYDAADAAGATATQLAILAAATGEFSAEQITAALKAAAIEEAVQQMGTQLANGTITMEGAIERLEGLKERMSDLEDPTDILATDIPAGAEDARLAVEEFERATGYAAEEVTTKVTGLKTAVEELPEEIILNIDQKDRVLTVSENVQRLHNKLKLLSQQDWNINVNVNQTGATLPDIYP